jgi:hypothetical protein
MYADVRQALDDVRNNWGRVSERYRYGKNRFFYHEDFISLLLFNREQNKLPKGAFIDYNNAFRYYHGQRRTFNLTSHAQDRGLEVPYHEVINFTHAPDTTIPIVGDVGEYTLPESTVAITNNALNAFLAERTNTTNNLALRLADLQETDGIYKAHLQSCGYYDEVRTALTLDYPIDTDKFETLRTLDLATDNQLPAFKDSLLVNHFGVFTTIAFRSNGSWFFHMMPRSRGLGVYSGMLSSVGGVVEPPKQPVTELVSYLKTEVVREVLEETGLDLDELEQAGRGTVVPLSFTRELSRGGKPQFFFLTVIDEMSEKEFAKTFKRASSKDEFRSDMFSNIMALDDVLSPEFSTALYYAFEYIQKRRKLPTDVIELP